MKNIIRLLFIVYILSACTEVIEVDLNDGQKRLVVEASMNWEKGSLGNNQVVKLSYSTPYYDQGSIEMVPGAEVKVIKLNDNTEFLFTEGEAGYYMTEEFVPELGTSYKLEIVHNGEVYEATETMQSVSNIEKIEEKKENIFGSEQTTITVYVDDDEGVDNFFHCEFYPLDGDMEQTVRNDAFSDGKQVLIEYEYEEAVAGDQLEINLYGISITYYNFMGILIEQSEGGGGPFATVPVPLKGNCKNINNPEEEVLGYFRLSQFIHEVYTVKE
ncbi:DUF4249 domain-containing protein [Aureibacter tunicatorum]|uniref:DUF4249 domain-containing protein n=1 Tax=Aureibacter tunicatorum TaxID=866807 RepID=A0AAE3XLR5_9BACT|nr:DUF4249 domain-containing protein [Aureibacter tunicatorum]MDR6238820.1 hypothetical protein [Aureibacter tunicatorum]BDD05253.1 hypothetical protein AUTU_27360 [Aureibacter tunicatorum]